MSLTSPTSLTEAPATQPDGSPTPPAAIAVTLYTDPACPWAYSALPALRVLEWRYGSQLDWRLVLVGLSEDTSAYDANGYTPLRSARSRADFRRRYGMPYTTERKARLTASAPACRAVVAARLLHPGSEWRVLRALQFANFTSPSLLDNDADLISALRDVPDVEADAIVAFMGDSAVDEAYRQDKVETRAAEGSAAELQGKTRRTDGPVRFTAPSLVFEHDGRRLVAGGFQPVEAYDVLVVNLDPTLERQAPPETPAPLLEHFADGLTTQEVAALLTAGNDAVDRAAAEDALLQLVADGRASRTPLGDDALWRAG
jgi:predicted DsbA family dithiol-disulfide isomerase